MKTSPAILIVDDDEAFCHVNRAFLEQKGFVVDVAHSGTTGIDLFEEKRHDVVLSDLCMEDMTGIEVLQKILGIDANAVIMIVTGQGDINSAVEAMKMGAFEYIEKPLSLEGDELLVKLHKAAEKRHMAREIEMLHDQLVDKNQLGQMVGKSAPMLRVFGLVKRVCATDTTVLIRGETGTGKEMVARSVHYGGARRRNPFMVINCPAFSEALLESELFGHEKGAFTGATQQHKGKFEYADGGTVFLDEVAELPMSIQTKLLRVLQFKEFQRVGGNETIRTDVRLIAATHQDLDRLVETGKFRHDLFYRLNVFQIELPPLKKRREDIPLLAGRFLRVYSKKLGKNVKGLSPQALETLLGYAWPGNVRELENVIERSLLFEEGNVLSRIALTRDDTAAAQASRNTDGEPLGAYDHFIKNHLAAVERQYFERLLDESHGKILVASEISGLNRRTLYRKLGEFGLNKAKYK